MQTDIEARVLSRELIAFFAWTLGLTYLIFWGPLALFHIPGASAGQQGQVGIGVLPFILGGFIPSIVGITLTAKRGGRSALRQLWRKAFALRFSIRWYVLMLAIPVAASCAGLFVQWVSGSAVDPAGPLAAMLKNPVLWIPFAIQILFLGPLSEEFGWRGYALDRLLARFTPLSGSLVLGILWAFWHLPLFYIPGTSQSAAGQPLLQFSIFAVGVVSETVIITWLYNCTQRSIGAAILTHATIGFAGTIAAYLAQPSTLGALSYSASYLVIATAILSLTKGRLGCHGAGPVWRICRTIPNPRQV